MSCYSRTGTFEIESAVRKCGSSGNLSQLNAKTRQILLLVTCAWTVTGKAKKWKKKEKIR